MAKPSSSGKRGGCTEALPGADLPGPERLVLCQPLLLAWARGYLRTAGIRDTATAENMVQETCVKILQSAFDWQRDEEHLLASLRLALHNTVRDELRHRHARTANYGAGREDAAAPLAAASGKATEASRDLERRDRLAIVATAVLRARAFFSDREWLAFHRRVVDGKTLQETAEWISQRFPGEPHMSYNKVRNLCIEIGELLSDELRAGAIDPSAVDPKTFPEQLRPLLMHAAEHGATP